VLGTVIFVYGGAVFLAGAWSELRAIPTVIPSMIYSGRLLIERGRVAKVEPFHSKVTKDVHHNDNTCKVGNNIESYNRVSGTGGLPLCKECAGLVN
jgi:hypothetical protein